MLVMVLSNPHQMKCHPSEVFILLLAHHPITLLPAVISLLCHHPIKLFAPPCRILLLSHQTMLDNLMALSHEPITLLAHPPINDCVAPFWIALALHHTIEEADALSNIEFLNPPCMLESAEAQVMLFSCPHPIKLSLELKSMLFPLPPQITL